jgi:hypothetical protein
MGGAASEVRLVEVPAVPTAVIAAATSWDAYPQLWPQLLEDVWNAMRATPGTEPGRNVMLYLDDTPHVEVGVELHGTFAGAGSVVPSALPGGTVARTVARGAPSIAGITAAHDAVIAWSADTGHALSGVRFEVYGHWRDHQDPAAFEVEVSWLLA